MKSYHDQIQAAVSKKEQTLADQQAQLNKDKKGLQSSMLAFSSNKNSSADSGAGGSGGKIRTTIRSSSPTMSETTVGSTDPKSTFVTEMVKRKADEIKNKHEMDKEEMLLKKQKQDHDIEMQRRKMALEERAMLLEEAKQKDRDTH